MPSLNRRFNFGAKLKEDNKDLYNQMCDMYEDISGVVNTKTSKVARDADPVADSEINKNYDIGDLWVNQTTADAWIMGARTTASAVTWKKIT